MSVTDEAADAVNLADRMARHSGVAHAVVHAAGSLQVWPIDHATGSDVLEVVHPPRRDLKLRMLPMRSLE